MSSRDNRRRKARARRRLRVWRVREFRLRFDAEVRVLFPGPVVYGPYHDGEDLLMSFTIPGLHFIRIDFETPPHLEALRPFFDPPHTVVEVDPRSR